MRVSHSLGPLTNPETRRKPLNKSPTTLCLQTEIFTAHGQKFCPAKTEPPKNCLLHNKNIKDKIRKLNFIATQHFSFPKHLKCFNNLLRSLVVFAVSLFVKSRNGFPETTPSFQIFKQIPIVCKRGAAVSRKYSALGSIIGFSSV